MSKLGLLFSRITDLLSSGRKLNGLETASQPVITQQRSAEKPHIDIHLPIRQEPLTGQAFRIYEDQECKAISAAGRVSFEATANSSKVTVQVKGAEIPLSAGHHFIKHLLIQHSEQS